MHQATAGFATDVKESEIGGVKLSTLSAAKTGVSYYVNVGSDGKVTITSSASYTVVNPISGETETTKAGD